MKRFVLPCLCTMLAVCSSLSADEKGQIVIFKLDDMSARYVNYERVVEFAVKEGIKVNFGVFGSALASGKQEFIDWIKELKKTGLFEFWNHGYGGFGHPKEFEGTGYEAQKEAIFRTQELSKEKLGEYFIAFGPHASAVDADTWKVLAERPEIRAVWAAVPAELAGRIIRIERKINMENPTTKMNKEKFLSDYAVRGKDLEYISLQGHPNAWDEAQFEQFKEVALFLKKQGCRFMTVSEFVRYKTGQGAASAPAEKPPVAGTAPEAR